MKKSAGLAGGLLLALATAGCEDQSRGFALPQGDVDRGKAAFVRNIAQITVRPKQRYDVADRVIALNSCLETTY